MEQRGVRNISKTVTSLLLSFAMYAMQPLITQASSVNEQQLLVARQIAANADWQQFTSRSVASKEPISHPLGVQTLSVEKRERKKQSSSATSEQVSLSTPLLVYQFHYDLAQARMLVVDTTTENVVDSHSISSVHLPLNETEIDFAINLVNQQSGLLDKFRDEQVRSGRTPFSQLEQLDVKASIYEPRDLNNACANQRCALLSLFDQSNTVFSTEPIVNLQTFAITLLGSR